MDSWIVHAWQVFDSWILMLCSLKNGEVFRTPTPFYFVMMQGHFILICASI